MMEQDWQLKVQCFVDAQLDEAGMNEVAAMMARNPEVAALVRELKHTRQALAGHDEFRPVPEPREFYWSKIERQIALEPRPEPVRNAPSPLGAWLRWLLPAGGAVALTLAGFFMAGGHEGRASTQWQAGFSGVNALTYYDHEEGMTVMWLTYPTTDAVAIEGASGRLP